MFLPHASIVKVSEEKICGYLLSTTHLEGKSKAVFFGKFGFSLDDWRRLAAALEFHVIENPVSSLETTPFGTRYVVDGLLLAPDGVALNIRSVWFINWWIEIPRFVTAHPLKRIAK